MGKQMAAPMLAMETYFVVKKSIAHIAIKINTAAGMRAMRAPPEVAMPLPPLKPIHGE